MTTTFIIAQIVGLLAAASFIISAQFKKKFQILITMILGSIFLAISLALLGGYSGAANAALGAVIAAAIFLVERRNGKGKIPWLLIALFVLAQLVSVILTFQDFWDVLPFIGFLFWMTALLQRKENRLRALTLGNLFAWSIYNIAVGAYAALISNVFSIFSTIIALIRFRKKSKKKIADQLPNNSEI